jgi:hypothetical protein
MSRRTLAVLFLTILSTTGCSLLPAGSSPAPSSTPSPTQAPSPTPTPRPTPPEPTPTPARPTPSTSPSPGTAFYLSGWYTQSIPPQYTFNWARPVTISDGVYINGNVAVPAIYPGPLMIVPVSRTITDAGIAAIAARAQELGLLDGDGDFSGDQAMPGAKLVSLDMVVDGITHHLVGSDQAPPCDPGPCAPGTPEAFNAFWSQLMMLDTWVPKELGESESYVPDRVALLLTDTDIGSFPPPPTIVNWPLDTSLSDADCLTLEGEDLATMMPILASATQLTVFADADTYRQPQARVLVPGEPSPCGEPG